METWQPGFVEHCHHRVLASGDLIVQNFARYLLGTLCILKLCKKKSFQKVHFLTDYHIIGIDFLNSVLNKSNCSVCHRLKRQHWNEIWRSMHEIGAIKLLETWWDSANWLYILILAAWLWRWDEIWILEKSVYEVP